MPAEAKRLAKSYDIQPIEVTRLTQLKNFDNIKGSRVLEKKYNQVKGQVATHKDNETLFAYWSARKRFIQEFFCLDA